MERDAYKDVAAHATMTGPAILIGVLASLLSSWLRSGGFDLVHFLASIGVWVLSASVLYLAGRALARKGEFAHTFRAVSFAHATYFLAPLALLPVAGPVFRALLLILLFVNTWLAAAAAHETRGWRTILLPVAAFAILVVGYILIGVLVNGMEFAVDGVLYSLGIDATP